jgi:dihydrofolate synthase/folylpolyglutamate synthase
MNGKWIRMNYKETLDYLYAHLPMFQRIGPAAYKKDLDNTLALCAHLGNPQDKFPCIHVGGTNGKGSVSHMLAAVCQAAGLKTGLYISPHYKDFRERIKVNGIYIPRKQVISFVAENSEVIREIEPSFFEVCVAMAFDHFANEKVDIAIIEVGLGGRLDSTNVIHPLLSVITNISYDHMNLLGDTLPQIAFEKAGIIKSGIPVVIGETHPESAPVFQKKALETGSEIVFADQHFQAEVESGDRFSVPAMYQAKREGKIWLDHLQLDAAGPFQSRNVATVLQAVEVLDRLPGFKALIPGETLAHDALRNGLSHLTTLTRFQGRWQIIGRKPIILCDSAHNEAGLRLAFQNILGWVNDQKKPCTLHLVTGFVNDKDVSKVLGLYPVDARYYFAKADIPRGMPATELKKKAAGFQLKGRAYSSVPNALKAAKRAAGPDDLIVVIGSIFVVAEVL